MNLFLKLASSSMIVSMCLGIVACSNPEEQESMVKLGKPVAQVHAVVETTPVVSEDDAADDAAIWLNRDDASLSRVLGTDKHHGLAVYNLQGEMLQMLERGRLNNVDIRSDILIDGALKTLAVASNRTDTGIDVFSIDAAGKVAFIGNHPLDLAEPYGICMFKTDDEKAQLLVNDKDGRYQQWQLDSLAPVAMTLVREFSVASQPEGCSVDETSGMAFIGEETHGVWSLNMSDKPESMKIIDRVNLGVLTADVEGMEVIRIDDETAYLIVSSQGDFTYAVYDAFGDYRYRGSFQVVAGSDIDGTQETDGLTASAANFGGPFEKGLLVIQDGFNRMPEELQNFKYVPWANVANALGLKTR